ncbi:MAG: nitrite/sulfite reductase [Dehalococcoidia bacterium]|nr:nitrite/sulfite reductase [Dehalococcoidia bacterium]
MVTTADARPILEPHIEEVAALEDKIDELQRGEIDAGAFRSFRLQQGVYGQRQPDVQMIRVKLPGGWATSDQMDAFATIAESYTGLGRGHISTRQNFQFHFIPLDDAPKALRLLDEVGLTTREACGNTVRNVTGCPWAGVEPGEAFDITPYLAAYARHMIRHPVAQKLPRKFKTVFSACPDGHDHTGVAIHDLGFVGRVRTNERGEEERGFRIVVGGGTSTMAQSAPVLYDFVPVDRYIPVAEAVIRVFNAEGGYTNFLRKNRNKARIKFLVKKIGIDEFRNLVEDELKGPWAREPIDLDQLMVIPDEVPGEVPAPRTYDRPENHETWLRTNVSDQKQPGFKAVAVTIPLGNITPEEFRALGRIMRDYSGGRARTSQNQNLVLRWVREPALEALHAELTELGFGQAGADHNIQDVVSCPGADSCALAITASMGLGRALSSAAYTWKVDDQLTEKISINISGCPNGCGQNHIGNIGFQGAALKVGDREVPAYDLTLGGGGLSDAGKFGKRAGVRIPSKRVPEAVQKIKGVYEAERQEGEEFVAFVDRVGADFFKPHLEGLEKVGPVFEDMDTYFDWDSQAIFSVMRGEGECAA